MAKRIILGKGGHARVLQDICGYKMFDIEDRWPEGIDGFVIGFGELKRRKQTFDHWYKHGPSTFIESVIHQTALIAPGAILGDGDQVLMGTMMQSSVIAGNNVLINTGAQIDHDCKIGDHCVISPGAILCGGVTLGHSCFVGAGAIIVENVTLAPETFVPAGTLVVSQVDMRKPVPISDVCHTKTPKPDENTIKNTDAAIEISY